MKSATEFHGAVELQPQSEAHEENRKVTFHVIVRGKCQLQPKCQFDTCSCNLHHLRLFGFLLLSYTDQNEGIFVVSSSLLAAARVGYSAQRCCS
jgi:hypothetical protein